VAGMTTLTPPGMKGMLAPGASTARSRVIVSEPPFWRPDYVIQHSSRFADDPLLADPDPPAVGPGTILVVDDDDDVRDVIKAILMLAGFDVVEASGGAEGLKLLRSDKSIRLVLLDLTMPEMDGWRFRHEQRSDPRLSQIPTIIVSGESLAHIVDEELCAADYLSKPVGRDHLIGVVAKYCKPVT
jgi:CheY-like chemotaxis protein